MVAAGAPSVVRGRSGGDLRGGSCRRVLLPGTLPCLLAAVAVLCVWQAVIILLPSGPQPPPAASARRPLRAGGSTDADSTGNSTSARAAAEALLRIARRSERTLFVMQVGACDGSFEGTDDPMQALMADEHVRALSLEPVPYLFADLRRRLAALSAADTRSSAASAAAGAVPRLQALNAAVCAAEKASVPFYVVSSRFGAEHPDAPHWQQRQLGSFKWEHLRKHHIPRRYIETIHVPCTTPAKLLAMRDTPLAGDPARVDALVVDAEGMDGELVRLFLQVSRFRPSLVIYERKHLKPAERRGMARFLEGLGYQQWPDRAQHIGVLIGSPLSGWVNESRLDSGLATPLLLT